MYCSNSTIQLNCEGFGGEFFVVFFLGTLFFKVKFLLFNAYLQAWAKGIVIIILQTSFFPIY